MSNEAKFQIPVIPTDTKYWIMRSGVESKYFEEFARHDLIALGWDRISEIQSIKEMTDFEPLKNIVLEKYPEIINSKYVSRKASDISGKIFKFINELKIGDIIVTPGKDDILIGKIIDEPYLLTEKITIINNKFVSETEKLIGELNKARKVNWLKRIERKNLEPNLKLILGIVHGIAHINNEQVITEINRSIYNYYQVEEKAHSVFKVNTQEEIDFEKYAFFIKSIHDIYNLLKVDSDNQKLFIKTNVQSAGPIELIGNPGIVQQIVLALRVFLKNDNSALQDIDEDEKEKVIKFKEQNEVKHNYDDYTFPTQGNY